MKILLWRLGRRNALTHWVLMHVSKKYCHLVMALQWKLAQKALKVGRDYECFGYPGVAAKSSAEALTDHLGGRQ